MIDLEPTCARIALALALAAPLAARASDGGPIQDNSFLVEEAYNQEAGVIQHISAFNRSARGDWVYAFTEEWPVLGQEHQASATFAYAHLGPRAQGAGDLALNYRWQALGCGEAALALAPRLTLLLPTGDASRGLGSGGAGLQVNLPLSAVLSERLVTHLNLGGTWAPSTRTSAGAKGELTSLSAGQSLVWLVHPRFNLLVEVVWARTAIAAPAGREVAETLLVNPGMRAAFDLPGGLQIVPGIGVPLGIGPSRGETALFVYLSFEHPFFLAGSQAEGR